nr:hypothetical protein [Thermus thermophilus]
MRRLEAVFSRHRESELTRLVRQGGGRPGPEMREVLAAALALKEATGGAFHRRPPTAGRPSASWARRWRSWRPWTWTAWPRGTSPIKGRRPP